MYVVTGVTGHTGSIIANTLLDRGEPVRVVVRDEAKAAPFVARGAQVAVADLGDTRALTAALTGARAAWLLVPPNMASPAFRSYQRETAGAIAEAARASRLPHAVLLSSVAAHHESGTGPIAGLHDAERLLAALPDTKTTFVRAAYFMENLGMSLSMLGQGLVTSFFPEDFAIPMIATRDIGRVGARVMIEGPAEDPILEFGGPDITMRDVAAALSDLLDKPITVAVAPLDAMVPTLTGFGVSVEIAEMYREMTAGMLSGHVAFEGGHRRELGTTPVRDVLAGLLGRP